MDEAGYALLDHPVFMTACRHSVLLLLVLATAGAATPTVGQDCDPVSENEQVERIAQESPLRMSYEGAFPRSSQGISATLYLDDDREIRALKVEYLGEIGRSRVGFRFQSRTSYTATWEEQTYETSIYEDPIPTVRSSREGCVVVENGTLRGSSDGSGPDRLEGLERDLDLILSDYLPCTARFGYTDTASIFLPYYEDQSPARLEELENLKQETRRVESACADATTAVSPMPKGLYQESAFEGMRSPVAAHPCRPPLW